MERMACVGASGEKVLRTAGLGRSNRCPPAIQIMFFRILNVAAFTAFAVLSNASGPTTTVTTSPQPTETMPANQCGGENLHCCDTIQYVSTLINCFTAPPTHEESRLSQSDSNSLAPLLAELNVVIEGPAALVGVHCTPVNVLGMGDGNKCAGQPVCCQNNDFVSPFTFLVEKEAQATPRGD
ncbi:putative hydrophobins [Lyophyllum shimeji]|uniref:Hydrophobin n=1 Tax=Lyophyllum shimeji TaxID=47721 RepID=A0A9P3USL6_LYOSH|nr:putative hydrophobins [Lyophyllum shimeji]